MQANTCANGALVQMWVAGQPGTAERPEESPGNSHCCPTSSPPLLRRPHTHPDIPAHTYADMRACAHLRMSVHAPAPAHLHFQRTMRTRPPSQIATRCPSAPMAHSLTPSSHWSSAEEKLLRDRYARSRCASQFSQPLEQVYLQPPNHLVLATAGVSCALE